MAADKKEKYQQALLDEMAVNRTNNQMANAALLLSKQPSGLQDVVTRIKGSMQETRAKHDATKKSMHK